MPGPSAKPFAQHRLSTIFLRVPWVDWAKVKLGHKREFRSSGQAVTQLWSVDCPTPVVAYAVGGPPQQQRFQGPVLMVLEKTWREPVGAISEESLAAEGFPDMAHFRRYYMQRTNRAFRPLTEVQVYNVRPWAAGDGEELAWRLLERLYGEYM